MFAQTNKMAHYQSSWRVLPVINLFFAEWQVWREEQAHPKYRLVSLGLDGSELPLYPLDMSPLLAVPFGTLDAAGVPYNAPTDISPAAYQPTTIAQYGLACWNAYLTSGEEQHKQAFLTQAHWLVNHETSVTDGAGGWPIPFPSYTYNAPGSWLSALTQGNCISVLMRACRLTGEEMFLEVARRAIRTFELDVRDGGISVSLGENGIFFEEVAAYPAAHILNGFIFALFGLYDYVALTHDTSIAALIQCSLATLHALIEQFDTGYWSRYDLRFRHLATHFYHALHITLLEALAQYSGCEHCRRLAAKWAVYQRSRTCCLRYFIVSRVTRYYRGVIRVVARKRNDG